MITVDAAIDTALQACKPLGSEELNLSSCLGSVLSEDVVSDLDMPPFNKSAMDGYALLAADTSTPPETLSVVGTIAAGTSPGFELKRGEAAKIMTGAPMPAGADSVQMVEKTAVPREGQVAILEGVNLGKHVALRGEILKTGDTVLKKGTYVSPACVGVLASVGQEFVKVYRRPKVAILVTGDEIVEVGQRPGPGQIRNSNGHALFSQVLACGALPEALGIGADDVDGLRRAISKGLRFDALLISGGVSMGDFDHVPGVLRDLGVELRYEKVSIKPGKPTVFGVTSSCVVFALPGNPVSASTIFEVIVKPCLRKMLGRTNLHNRTEAAVLREPFKNKTGRTNYHPAVTALQDGQFLTKPVSSRGSADILAFAGSNSYIIARHGQRSYSAGDQVEVMLRDEFWQTL